MSGGCPRTEAPKGRARLGAGRGPPPYTPLLQGCSLSFLLSQRGDSSHPPSPAGVQFDIDLPNKKVSIDSEHDVDKLLETLGKTGKAVSYLGPK